MDGKEDEGVYCFTLDDLNMIKEGMRPPTYIEKLKERRDSNNQTYYSIIKEKGFQFVHEVQRWLRDEMQDVDLEIVYTARPRPRIRQL